jgi:glycosyltransferase involved in cell wall biosynthesis
VGDIGLKIDPDNPSTLATALRRTLTDTEWRTNMQDAGLKRAALFTWENTARTVLSVYHTLE